MLSIRRIHKISKIPFTIKINSYVGMSNQDSKKENYSDISHFQEEFIRNHIKLTTIQKTILGIGSSIASLYNPRRVDMLACCAEIICVLKLKIILEDMQACMEGSEVLRDKPRILTKDTTTKFLSLPKNTFGWSVAKFLRDNNIVLGSEIPVKFITDLELGYIMIRCRQIHDFLHVLLNIPTNRVGEVTIKWIEAINMGFPTAYLAAIAGSGYVNAKDCKKFINYFLPMAFRNANVGYKFYSIYWERKFEYDLENLRSELGVKAF